MERYNVDKEYIRDVGKKLLQIDTVNNPERVNDYWQGINYLKTLMEDLGLEIIIDGKENYPNIIGLLKGTGKSDRTLMFNAHLDTVPVGDADEWLYDPFGGEEKDGFVYGRGACDMKGQIAFLMGAVKYFVDNRTELDGDLKVAFVTGHETGSVNGSVWMAENKPELLKADMCFIPEATSGKITVSSRGIFWVKATTKGLMGHSATFNETGENGNIPPINAIHKMMGFTQRILDVDAWMEYETMPHVGANDGMYSEKPIVELNIVRGGEKQNTVPDSCEATFDIRFLPGQTPEKIMRELEALAEKIREEDPEFEISFETDMIQSPPIHVEEDSEIYRLGEKAYKDIYGKDITSCGVCAPGDAVAFGRLMPVAWLGPNWDNVHGYNEKFEIDDMCKCAELYISIALNYLTR